MWYYLIVFLFLGPVELLSELRTSNCPNRPETNHEIHINKRDVNHQCHTPICKKTIAKMLYSMNHKAKPCEDFSEYICGNMNLNVKSFSKEDFKAIDQYLHENVEGQSKNYLRVFRAFYRSCIEFDPYHDFIANMKSIKKNTTTNLTEMFTESILTQSMPFFDIGIDIDVEDQTYIFQITLPGKSFLRNYLKDWSIFQLIENECIGRLEKSSFSKEVYLDELYEKFKACKHALMMKYARKYKEDMDFAINIESSGDSLTTLLQTLENIRNNSWEEIPSEMTVDTISQKYGLIDWKTFFETIITNKTFRENERIQIHFPGYLEKAFELMNKYNESDLVELLQEFSSFQQYKNFFHVHEDRKLFCMDLSQQLMPDIATVIQYEIIGSQTFISSFRSKIIFENLKITLKNSLDGSSLDSITKKAFKKKLDKLTLGLIDSGNYNATEDNYMKIIISENYIENVLTLLRNYRSILFSLVGEKTSAASLLNYFVSPFYSLPKAFYSSKFIVLHPAILNRIPPGTPDYIEKAKLGLLLAQGIAKHFDPIGRSYMTDDSDLSNEFYQEIIIDQTNVLLNEYYLVSPRSFHGKSLYDQSIKMSEQKIMNELISDNTAFRMITDYFNITSDANPQLPWIDDSFTIKETFFIAAAQEFCDRYSEVEFMRDLYEGRRVPFQMKIENMVKNSEAFADAFQCPSGSEMRLEVMVQFPHAFSQADFEPTDTVK